MLPKKWYEICPNGTKEGDEEQAFFKAIARSPKWDWRTVQSISNQAKLPEKRILEIIEKYSQRVNPPLIYQHESNKDLYGYWENIQEHLPKEKKSLAKIDQENRMKKKF